MHKIFTRTSFNGNYLDGVLGVTLCSNGTCCSANLQDENNYEKFEPGFIDQFSGTEIDPCDGFSFELSDLNVTISIQQDSWYDDNWGGLYIQLEEFNGAGIRCQAENGSEFTLMENENMTLNCSEAPESKFVLQ